MQDDNDRAITRSLDRVTDRMRDRGEAYRVRRELNRAFGRKLDAVRADRDRWRVEAERNAEVADELREHCKELTAERDEMAAKVEALRERLEEALAGEGA